jgi:hypothetical protein
MRTAIASLTLRWLRDFLAALEKRRTTVVVPPSSEAGLSVLRRFPSSGLRRRSQAA